MNPVKKVQLEQGLVVGLILVLGVIVVKGPLKQMRGSPSRAGQGAKPLEVLAQKYTPRAEIDPRVMPPPPTLEEVVAAPPIAYTAQEMRDPFKSLLPAAPATPRVEPRGPATAAPRGGAPSVPPELLVQGLVWGGTQPKAIIRGTVYGVGDMVEGVKIVAIDQRGVTIDHEGLSVSYPVAAPASAASRGASPMRPPLVQGGYLR